MRDAANAQADLLKEVVALDDRGQKALNHFGRMIQQKNIVSYSGEVYTREDIDKLWKQLDRYKEWALTVLSR